MRNRTRLAALLAVIALAAGCGSRTGDPTADGRSFGPGGSGTPTPTGTASTGTGGTGGNGTASASPGTGTGGSGTADPAASGSANTGVPGSKDRFCTFGPTVRCTKDAKVAREWWVTTAMLEAPANIPHTYVMLSPKGFGPEVEPDHKDKAALHVVLHPRGGDPATTPVGEIITKHAMLISGTPIDPSKSQAPAAGKPILVQGQQGYVFTTPERDGRPATRLMWWYETRGGKRILWTTITLVKSWPNEDEVVRTINSMERS